MKLRFLIFFLLLSPPGWAGSLAVIPLQNPDLSGRQPGKLERLIRREAKKTGTSLVATRDIQKQLRVLDHLLEEELQAAWNDYYSLSAESARLKIAGREDLEALLLGATIASATGEQRAMRDQFLKILRIDPQTSLSPEKFSPTVMKFFENLRKEVGMETGLTRRPARHLKNGFTLRETLLEAWEGRLIRFARRAGWDELLLVGIEPIGWNYKVFGHLLAVRGDRPSGHFRAEIKHLRDLPLAARVIVRELLSTDTAPGAVPDQNERHSGRGLRNGSPPGWMPSGSSAHE